MPETTGTYQELDGEPTITFRRTFPHPVDEVWAAITDPDRLGKWFPTSVEFAVLRPGSPIEFRFAQDAYPPLEGEFREVQAPQELSFTWGEDVLSFQLAEAHDGDACTLTFTVILDAADKAARDAAGWDACLDGLAGTLAASPPPEAAGGQVWRDYYERYQAAGLPATAEIPTPQNG
jgi:uncharacterized protein YndB with AHSA1/START domain